MKKIYSKSAYLLILMIFYVSSAASSSVNLLSESKTSVVKDVLDVMDGKPQIKEFRLIDAITDRDLFEVKEGSKINLKEIGTRHINIRAKTDPSESGSVLFQLSGQRQYEHIENIAPYALFANDKGNYFRWNPEPGMYTLTATPFTEEEGKGKAGTAYTINFRVIDDLQVVGFFLVNADNNKDIFEITDGMEIDVKKLPSQNINVRANTVPSEIGSVELSISDLIGDNFYSHVENAIPYALFSDHKGDYYARPAENGHYSLQAIPYQLNNARGTRGHSLKISFKMINGDNFSSSRFTQSDVVLEAFTVFPNPGKNALNIFLKNQNSKNITIQIMDLMGNEVLNKSKKTDTPDINLTLDVSGLESRPYVIKLSSDKSVTSVRWIKE